MDNDVFEKSNERMPAPLNAFVSKTVKAGLNIRCILRLTHPANAKVLICETFLKSMEYRFVHPSNACVPIEVTAFGMVKVEKREAQFLNNEVEIDERENKLKLETDVSFEQF